MENNNVPNGCECPKCGERDADNLLITEDETVHCQRCGEIYSVANK